MLGASAGELVVPLYIGTVIDLLKEGDYDRVGTLSGYMLIAVVVSISININTLNLNLWLIIIVVALN